MSPNNTLQNIPLSESDSFLEDFSDNSSNSEDRIPWSNGVYKVWWNIRRLFSDPFKKKNKELRLLDQIDILINSGDAKEVADVCEKYISLHRIVENTKARTRLEKWVTRLIVGYLIVVGGIVLADSFSEWLRDWYYPYIKLDTSVLIALLTTTTINIVALGIILVRGLFHENETKDISKEKTKKDSNNKD